jgi:hypothetical protein
MAPRTSIRITDPATVIRAAPDAADGPAAELDERRSPGVPLAAELVTRRWSWPCFVRLANLNKTLAPHEQGLDLWPAQLQPCRQRLVGRVPAPQPQ